MDKETERGLQTFRRWVADVRPGGMVFFGGSHLVIVNRTPTPRDRHADLCLAANVGRVFDF